MRALLLALVATGSLMVVAPALSQTGKNVGMRGTPHLNLTGFSNDPNALPSAVSAIERLSGGRVAEIRFDNISGVPGYDVVVAQGDHVRFQRLNMKATNVVAFSEAKTPAWMLDWRSQRNAAIVRDAKVPLADAIRTAQASQRNAPAVAAGISRSAAGPTTSVHAYNVALLTSSGDQRRVAVNSLTGNIISNPEALPRW